MKRSLSTLLAFSTCGPTRRPRRDVLNNELHSISFDLPIIIADASPEAETFNDPFLHYLHGLVLVEKDLKEQAKAALCAACRGYPCNWGAWQVPPDTSPLFLSASLESIVEGDHLREVTDTHNVQRHLT